MEKAFGLEQYRNNKAQLYWTLSDTCLGRGMFGMVGRKSLPLETSASGEQA